MERVSSIVMALLRTMKDNSNCFVQSVFGVVVLRILNKEQVSVDGFDSDRRMSCGVGSGVNVIDVDEVHGKS